MIYDCFMVSIPIVDMYVPSETNDEPFVIYFKTGVRVTILSYHETYK